MPTETELLAPRGSEARTVGWLDGSLRWSLQNRSLVLLGAAVLLVWGWFAVRQMPIDVLPDLTAPTVAVLTEAHGPNP